MGKNGYTPKRFVDFPWERDTFRNKIMDIVEDFDESYNNNGKPWKSSRILRVNPNVFIFFLFSSFCSMFFTFFHLFHFSFFFFIFPFFSFFIFLHFSFIFIDFLTFSSIFFHFLSFSLSLWGAQILIFFGPQFRYDFSSQYKSKIQCFGPSRGYPL